MTNIEHESFEGYPWGRNSAVTSRVIERIEFIFSDFKNDDHYEYSKILSLVRSVILFSSNNFKKNRDRGDKRAQLKREWKKFNTEMSKRYAHFNMLRKGHKPVQFDTDAQMRLMRYLRYGEKEEEEKKKRKPISVHRTAIYVGKLMIVIGKHSHRKASSDRPLNEMLTHDTFEKFDSITNGLEKRYKKIDSMQQAGFPKGWYMSSLSGSSGFIKIK